LKYIKVKCDERPGQCGNCARLRLVCSGYSSAAKQQTEEVGEDRPENSKRKRTYRSCIGCRSSKTKCSGDRPACQRCRRKNIECVYTESCQPNWIRRIEDVSPEKQNSLPTPSVLSNGSPINNIPIHANESCRTSFSSIPTPEPHNSSLEW